jgi:amidase
MTQAPNIYSSARTQIDRLALRQVSAIGLLEEHIARHQAVNPAINAVTAVLGEQAVEAAKAADRVVAAGGYLPPFHGVPFTVKENVDLAGTPTTMGLKALAGAYPSRDAPVVERLRAAGAIPVGHTNCPNITVRWHTDSELWGATVNPGTGPGRPARRAAGRRPRSRPA